MSLRRLRKSDIRSLSEELGVDLDKKADIQRADDAIVIDDALSFIRHPDCDGWVPAIPWLLSHEAFLPVVVVDMGAVAFLARGADVMRPGITEVPDAPAGALVQVVDERNRKPLAVGLLLFSGEELRAMESGRAIQTLHHVGDAFWEQYSH